MSLAERYDVGAEIGGGGIAVVHLVQTRNRPFPNELRGE
jgi:hypothetical protein